MSDQVLSNKEYNQFRESEFGKTLISQSEADAASFLFDLQSGEKNSVVAEKLTPKEIYTAVSLASSLSFEINGVNYYLEPYYSEMSEQVALEVLQDSQTSIENCVLSSHFKTHNAAEKKLRFLMCVEKGISKLVDLYKESTDDNEDINPEWFDHVELPCTGNELRNYLEKEYFMRADASVFSETLVKAPSYCLQTAADNAGLDAYRDYLEDCLEDKVFSILDKETSTPLIKSIVKTLIYRNNKT